MTSPVNLSSLQAKAEGAAPQTSSFRALPLINGETVANRNMSLFVADARTTDGGLPHAIARIVETPDSVPASNGGTEFGQQLDIATRHFLATRSMRCGIRHVVSVNVEGPA